MRPARVYLDTSVIGGCFDDEFAEWSNALMHDFESGVLVPVVSELVTIEIEPAPKRVREQYARLLTWGAETLEVNREVVELSEVYAERGIVPPKFTDDARHVAFATASRADLIASWNFKHIVHFDRIRLFNAVNMEMGYRPIDIRSPKQIAYHGRQT
jgi:predicted nucleic acid-binding protein